MDEKSVENKNKKNAKAEKYRSPVNGLVAVGKWFL